MYNYLFNQNYNKILNCYWFPVHLFVQWVSNNRCPIRLFVIAYPRDSHINYVCFNGFLHNVSFKNLRKVLQTFSLQRSSHKIFLILKFVIDKINYLLDLMSYNSGSYCVHNLASHYSDFEITCMITPCCTPLNSITITSDLVIH